jgi:ABC-type bacteriocin/lantibiotic exporter with double-glycine peptidase domain
MRTIAYLWNLLRFSFRENPLFYACIVVTVFSVAIELLAMASLLPLISIGAGNLAPGDALMVRAMRVFGIEPTTRALLMTFVGLFSVRVVTLFASQALISLVSKRLLAQLTTRAFATLVTLVPIKEVEQKSIGSYITLVGDEAYRASNIVTYLNQAISVGLLAVLYLLAVIHYSLYVGLGVVVFLCAGSLLLLKSLRVSSRLGGRQVEQGQAASTLFMEALNGLRSVRAFSAEAYVAEAYRRQVWQYVRTLVQVDAVSMLSRVLPALLLLALVGLAAAWPTSERFAPDLPAMITIVIFLMRFFPVVGQLLQIGLRIVADAKAGRDVTHMVDIDQPAAETTAANLDPGPVAHIELRNLSFAHRQERPLLGNVSARFERGRSYAIVGESGSGKSTLLDLLLDFYPIEQGDILVNSVPMREIGEKQLRKRIVLVSQSTTIFNDTVANNLRFGLQVPLADVERVCRIACADRFVEDLPQGYDTVLAYQGGNLSGGQRQRLGIARALLRNPEVLLLDECTSALDAETRDQLVENLLTQFRSGILIFVTHDTHIRARVDEVIEMRLLNRIEAG